MSEWTLEQALKLAIEMENESIQIYTSAQEKVRKFPGSKELLKELVNEEKKHKNKILTVVRSPEKVREIGSLATTIHDLKIVDWLEDVSLSPEASYQQILIYAGKREKATHDLYMELAKKYRGKQIGEIFFNLAQEELKHKYELEREYDDIVLKGM